MFRGKFWLIADCNFFHIYIYIYTNKCTKIIKNHNVRQNRTKNKIKKEKIGKNRKKKINKNSNKQKCVKLKLSIYLHNYSTEGKI